MTQMYQVDFQTHYENLIDVGKVIVCASSVETASDMAISLLNLPQSRTICKTTRIKPSIYVISRREIKPERKPSSHNGARRSSDLRDMMDFDLHISAIVSGTDEKHAMRRLTGSLIQRNQADHAALDKHTKKLMVDCNPVQHEQRQLKSMEQVELYKVKGFMGGSAKYANASTKITDKDLKRK